MKLAFSTLGCPDWSWEQILKNASEVGFDGFEIRGLEGEMRPERMARFMPGQQQDTLRDLKNAGLAITDIGTSATFHDPAGYDAAAIAERCGVARAEADLVVALMRSQARSENMREK